VIAAQLLRRTEEDDVNRHGEERIPLLTLDTPRNVCASTKVMKIEKPVVFISHELKFDYLGRVICYHTKYITIAFSKIWNGM